MLMRGSLLFLYFSGLHNESMCMCKSMWLVTNMCNWENIMCWCTVAVLSSAYSFTHTPRLEDGTGLLITPKWRFSPCLLPCFTPFEFHAVSSIEWVSSALLPTRSSGFLEELDFKHPWRWPPCLYFSVTSTSRQRSSHLTYYLYLLSSFALSLTPYWQLKENYGNPSALLTSMTINLFSPLSLPPYLQLQSIAPVLLPFPTYFINPSLTTRTSFLTPTIWLQATQLRLPSLLSLSNSTLPE